MQVITPPPKHSFWRRLSVFMLVACSVAAVATFLVYRFGDTPVEKAEKLFAKRQLTALRDFTRTRLEKGDTNPVLYAYYAVGEFSVNPKASLAGVLSNIKAVDERPIFRREALARILQVKNNAARAGEILTQLIDINESVGGEMKDLIDNLVGGDIPLESDEKNFARLQALLPQRNRTVHAKELQWRTAPSTESEVIRRLDADEELLLRKMGTSTVVSGKKGHWAYVLDKSMHSGWVFDAYVVKPKPTAPAPAPK